jgi:hypothetical protein
LALAPGAQEQHRPGSSARPQLRGPGRSVVALRRLRGFGGVPPIVRLGFDGVDELRALRRLQRASAASLFVVVNERGAPSTAAVLARMLKRAAAGAGLEIKAHPRMLRHACGYALANKGHYFRAIQGWLGHRSITSTAVYTALAPNRLRISVESKLQPVRPDSCSFEGRARLMPVGESRPGPQGAPFATWAACRTVGADIRPGCPGRWR